jgi:hypothetical protein
MSSINSGYRGNRPAGTSAAGEKDDKNLSDLAKDMGLFQNSETEGTEDTKEGAKGGKGGKLGKAGKPHGMHGGMSTKSDTIGGSNSVSGPKAESSPSFLPDPNQQEPGKVSAEDLAGLDPTAAPLGTNESIEAAHAQLAADMADPNASVGTLALDIHNLSAEMTAGGITTPVSQVINDMVDPKGKGITPSENLVSATKAQGINLKKDNVDVAAAQKSLDASMAIEPANTAAISMDVAHVVRVTGLTGADASKALDSAASKIGSSKRDPLAALYAAAAKNGIDITDKGKDAASAALNDKATKTAANKAKAAAAQAAQAAQQQAQQQAQQNAGSQQSHNQSGGGGGGSPSNNTGATTASRGNYAPVPSTGSGRSAGGWDTSGNQSIEPNPANPVDWAKEFNMKGGFTSISLDEMLAKVPQLTASYPNIKQMLTDAAASSNPALPPQLLLSTLGVETSFAQNFGTNAKDGPFQFIESTFAAYGSGDRTNMADAAKACANYYATLLHENGGDLFAAMRDYNGDVNLGASNSYQKDQQDMFNGTFSG